MRTGTPFLVLLPLLAARLPAPPSGSLEGGRLPVSEGLQATSSESDSQRVLAEVRSRQARFEAARRRQLPWVSAGSVRRCEERIGRFCLWHDDENLHQPRREPESVRRGRDELIAELARAAVAVPGDEWIAGQRVRYLVEAGRHQEALRGARECRAAASWWCRALEGFALHSGGDHWAADSVFLVALREMPADERCRWTDLTLLLIGRARERYQRLACPDRAHLEEEFWWLADPFHMLPGNDRRTEHFARLVTDHMLVESSSAYGVRWGGDLRELVVRYGWPRRWERVRSSVPGTPPQIVSHYPKEALHFAPPANALGELASIGPGDWPLDVERPRSSYAPSYAESVQEFVHQLAVFTRGDSARVVVAYEVSPDGGPRSASAEIALLLSQGPLHERVSVRDRVEGEGGAEAQTASVEAVPTLLSLEALDRSDQVAARARYGIRPAKVPEGLLALSDLLLLAQARPLPDSLDAAIPLARGSNRVRSGEPLGVYWEVYGLSGAEQLGMSLTLRGNRGWLRSVVEWLGLARQARPVTLSWQERVLSPTVVLERSLELELPALSAGSYTLQLTVTASGRMPLVTRRAIEVVE